MEKKVKSCMCVMDLTKFEVIVLTVLQSIHTDPVYRECRFPHAYGEGAKCRRPQEAWYD